MNEFDELWDIATTLNGPKGCPWDVKQTFKSLQPYVLEEAHELLDALDENDDRSIIEELGDVLYTVLFFCKVAEREGRFKLKDVLSEVKEKLVRRHPHVFGEVRVEKAEEVMAVWEGVKAEEKKERKSVMDGIPKSLETLAKAHKVIEKINRHDLAHFFSPEKVNEASEEGIAEGLIKHIYLAVRHDIDSVGALRRAVASLETRFREWEEVVDEI